MKVGVLGGGQLGRMLALAGLPLGVKCVFYDHSPQACAAGLGDFVCGEFEDAARLAEFAAQVDVITLEFENIPLATLEQLAPHKPVYPPPAAVRVAQDRFAEKALFSKLAIPTPRSFEIHAAAQLHEAATALGGEAIVKTSRLGYDGKGQARLQDAAQAEAIWTSLGSVPLIAEQRMAFEREVSLLAVRGRNGEIRFYPLVENVHDHGILVRSEVRVGDPLQAQAEAHAQRVLEHLDYVGLLAFEFFDCAGTLYANEIAPRVHNTGHWSIEGAVTSQFENHLRAILGWPLGETTVSRACVMYNLIGEMPDTVSILRVPGAHLHDYGKAPRPGRKLGHITLCNPTPASRAAIEAAITIVR